MFLNNMNIAGILIVGVLGLIVGSFLNVVVLRMNTGRGLGGRSQCFSCNKTLAWYELIPVISFVIQKGKCRACKSKVSAQYSIVELVTGLLFAGVAWRVDLLTYPFTGLLVLAMVALGIIIATYDVMHTMIPVTPLVLLFGVTVALGMHGIGFVIVPLPFLILWKISQGRWIGFGDIELMACIGMLLGVVSGFSAVIISFWIACLVMVPWFVIQKLREKKINHQVPFGPFLLVGMYGVAILGWDVLTLVTTVVL
jgi:prepilin signal peptidase PulO-like enzyme (type II secretory pathway)